MVPSMVSPARLPARAASVTTLLVLGWFISAPGAEDLHSPPALVQAGISHHDLSVTIDPMSHRLKAHDRLAVSISPSSRDSLHFTLAPTLHVTHLRAVQQGRSIPVSFTSAVQPSTDLAGESTQVVTVRLSERVSEELLFLEWRYEGVIHDPLKEPRHLRFVTPSHTSGFIGVEGVYLSGESQWYPDQVGSLATFCVAVTLPAGWSPVTHGRQIEGSPHEGDRDGAQTTRWEISDRTEALTLVANQFVRTVREWKDGERPPVRLETDLLSGNAHLADEYLEASARYLETYSRLLGPYPFTKFAVVENFFASGLGMPSFTLLGSGVIKRHYVQPYALGHEIVHSWIGNAVFNRPGAGNWVEGLTTYLANYYYDELTNQEAQAQEQRRLMLAGYAVYVPSDLDYPLAKFMRKTDQRDNAIGYQKAAMVFHLLRQEIGESAFWGAIRRLGEQYRGQQVDWGMLERLFSRESGKSLRLFFSQWVERPGAPDLTVSASVARSETGRLTVDATRAVSVRIEQAGMPFQILLPVVVRGSDGARFETQLPIAAATQSFSLHVPFEPIDVLVDPEFHVFRRLGRAELPPMLNLLVTDPQRTVVVSKASTGEEAGVYRRIVERLTGQEPSASDGGATTVVEKLDRPDTAINGSVLFLGAGEREDWARLADPSCGQRVHVEDGRLLVDGIAHEGLHLALLVSCPRREGGRGQVVTWFFGTTPEAAGKVARLLFFYGWHSYLVFRDGSVVARGDFEPPWGRVQVTHE